MHRFSDEDISKATTVDLIAELRIREEELEHATNKYERRALELRIGELQQWIGIHNARATHALDGMSEEQLQAIEDTLNDTTQVLARGVVLDLVKEVRRLQGQLAGMFPRYVLKLEELRPSAGPENDDWPLERDS